MNRVLWLQGQAGILKIFKGEKSTVKKNSSLNKAGNNQIVYIALPLRNGNPASAQAALKVPPGIFVVMPQNAYLRKKAATDTSFKRKSLISAAALSFFCFIAIIFIAIGILNLMISSFKLQAYTPGYIALEQTAHKPGSGPAIEDAVVNEYQHALTREMIAAADTTLITTAERPESGRGMLEKITLAEEPADAAAETSSKRKVKIYNGTAKTLDRVVVQIDVLDKAGHLQYTEYHTARGIAPLGNKVVALDHSAPGAQIRCYVQELRSKSLRTSLRSL